MPNPFDITLANLRDFLDTIVEGGSMSPNERRRIRRDLVELRRVYYAALQTPPLVPAGLLEVLADLEHEQWIYWSQAMAVQGFIPQHKLDRWSPLWVPYRDLPEASKEFDRVFARRVLEVFITAGILQQ